MINDSEKLIAEATNLISSYDGNLKVQLNKIRNVLNKMCIRITELETKLSKSSPTDTLEYRDDYLRNLVDERMANFRKTWGIPGEEVIHKSETSTKK